MRTASFQTKKQVNIDMIRRVQCVTNGAISNLCIFAHDKKGFFDSPELKIPLNALTVPLLDAIVTRNTGTGIDFSRGNGFDQKTSEYIIIRYFESGYFLSADGATNQPWQEHGYSTRTPLWLYDLEMLL